MSVFLGSIYKILINLFLKVIELTAKIPFSRIYVKTPYLYQIIIYYIAVFIALFMIKKQKTRIFLKYQKPIIIVLLIIMLIPNLLDILPSGKLKIYFIDVGQGDSTLLVTPENTKILIDRRRK